MQKLNRKGALTLGQAPAAVIAMVIIGIVLTIGALIIDKFKEQTVAGTVAANATTQTLSGIEAAAKMMPIVGIVVFGAIILGLVAYFGMRE
jgi:TRAP-type uncharacterized transport system fused permease subunit